MKVINKVQLKLDGFDKCSLISDSDCSLGQLYDYACSLKSFLIEKMKEVEQEVKKHSEHKEE